MNIEIWKYRSLGEMFDFVGGGTPSKKELEYWNGNIPWASVKDIKGDFLNQTQDFITENGLKNSASNIAEIGDVILITRIVPGRSIITNLRTAINQDLKIAKPKFRTTSKFIHYFFSAIERECLKLASGTTVLGITLNNLNELKIPDLSLLEQNSIVSKIEELFSELDKGIENLKTAQQQLKTYRQAVLKWAFEGRLTNKNVKEGELPKGWKLARLDEVCDKIQDGSHFSPQLQYDEPGKNRFKYITAKNIRNDYMDFRKVIYVDKEFHDSIYSRCNPEFGDVLLTKDGVNTGEVTLNTLHEPFSLLSSVCIFKTKKEKLKSEFLKYFIQSPFGGQAILDSMTGTAIKRIVLRKIRSSEIVQPTMEEQERIVQEIESRLSVADKMEESISQSLQQSEALRQSILKKAFEGKL